MTLFGQILLRCAEGIADEYEIVIRPVHRPLVVRALPALRRLGVRVPLVKDDSVEEFVNP